MVNSENDAGCEVWYSASAAAIFIGWYVVMILPWMSPVIAVNTAATSDGDRADLGRRAERRGGGLRGGSVPAGRRIRCHRATPTTSAAGDQEAARDRVRERDERVGLVSTARKLVSSARCVTGLKW